MASEPVEEDCEGCQAGLAELDGLVDPSHDPAQRRDYIQEREPRTLVRLCLKFAGDVNLALAALCFFVAIV